MLIITFYLHAQVSHWSSDRWLNISGTLSESIEVQQSVTGVTVLIWFHLQLDMVGSAFLTIWGVLTLCTQITSFSAVLVSPPVGRVVSILAWQVRGARFNSHGGQRGAVKIGYCALSTLQKKSRPTI